MFMFLMFKHYWRLLRYRDGVGINFRCPAERTVALTFCHYKISFS